jgi:aminoglycoside/choline kinase family phosphotransferase
MIPVPADETRSAARADFLRGVGKAGAALDPLPADASARRYFRLSGSRPPMLLMDSPPPGEDIRPFVRIARHLQSLGLSPPALYELDEPRGFALIEDFGDATFTRLLDAGHDARPLFAAAADALVVLHTHASGAAVAAPAFDRAKMLDEVGELPEWYGPACAGLKLASETFVDLWNEVLDRLPPPEARLVLLDYHVDNLMWLPDRSGAAACGLLDFQDARIGPRPYDLLVLLRNERRGVGAAISDAVYARYIAAARPADPAAFGLWFRVLAAQRYTKVVGRFSRLTLRDGRDGYLRYLPRVLLLLSQALDAEPLLHPIRGELDRMLPQWRTPPKDDPAAMRARVALAVGQP